MSVGGMVANRKQFSNHLPGVDHMQDTHIPELNAFSKGQPKHGVERAHSLIDLINLHDASTIAAVIIEPVACSTGVLVPPIGYLEEIREICTKNGILLIFDEVICGFGRLGAPFSADKFNVIPDIMTLAKGLTNATVPMGAVATHKKIYDGLMHGPENVVELFHGYTYSGHSLACAAALATLEEYEAEKLFDRANSLEKCFEEHAHKLKDLDNVIDIRTIGLVAGIELKNREDGVGKRVYDVWENCFENNLLTRFTGETLAISPPLIVTEDQIKLIFDIIRSAILEVK
jgi:beta-alanine--pyruvate transaminase